MANVGLLYLVLGLAAVLSALRTFYIFRARAMRRLASKWGYQYLGPTTPPQWWFVPSRNMIPAPLPGWFYQLGISQAWNIIEGENNGATVFVFDGLSRGFRGGQPCTYIACETEQCSFPITTSVEPVIKIRGWTVLHGVWFLWFSWLMSIRRLNRHLNYIRPD
jgi:hypothetical protein